MRLGEIKKLLFPLSKPLAGYPADTKRQPRLNNLKTGIARICPGIKKRGDSPPPILLVPNCIIDERR